MKTMDLYNPFEHLTEEHRLVMRQLTALKQGLAKLEEGAPSGHSEAIQAVRNAVQFLRKDFVEHMEKEEMGLFLWLDLRMAGHGVVTLMRLEHQDLRDKILEISQLTEGIESADKHLLKKAQRKVARLRSLTADHLIHEQEELFPLLTRGKQMTISSEVAEQDSAQTRSFSSNSCAISRRWKKN